MSDVSTPVVVLFSTGDSIKIGSLKWKRGLVPLKNLILETLQTPGVQKGLKRILQTLSETASSVGSEDIATIGTDAIKKLLGNYEELSSVLPEAIAEISKRWDEMTEVLVYGCVEKDQDNTLPIIDFDELSLEDVVKLRKAVNAVNDWQQIWDTEKNSVVDMFGKLMRNISTGMKTGSSLDGGQDGKQSLSVADTVSAI